METNIFRGTGVALITPFEKDLSVDYKALDKQLERLISGGIDYLVVFGTTSEYVTLESEEQNKVLHKISDKIGDKMPIVLGIGGNNTAAVVNKIKNTDFNGISGILSVAPYYNKPTQEGLYLHFKSIAEVSPVPVIIYNVPGRTGVNISAETTVKLAKDFKNIIATKEASGNLSQVMDIIKNRPENFLVISGDDGITLPMIALGGDGVISVVGNAFPKEFSEMVNLSLEGEFDEARKIHYSLIEIIDYLFIEGNPSGVKAALDILGCCSKVVRPPLVPVSDKIYNKLKELIH